MKIPGGVGVNTNSSYGMYVGVYNHWTGLVDWTGLVNWTTGLKFFSEILFIKMYNVQA